TISSFLQNAFGDRFLELRRDIRSAEGLDHSGQRIHQVLDEMFDPARTAAEVPLQTGPHHSPAKSRPVAHPIVRGRDAQHTLLDQVQDLSVQRSLKPVPYMTG